jgi:membrane protein implicated in regulation of membrane protease activity
MRAEPPFWLVGLIVGGVVILVWLGAALIWRALSILIGSDLATIGVALAVILCLLAALIDWWTDHRKKPAA